MSECELCGEVLVEDKVHFCSALCPICGQPICDCEDPEDPRDPDRDWDDHDRDDDYNNF